MNSKYEGIALELTRIYADKCNGLAEERVVEIYQNYLDKLSNSQKDKELNDEVKKNAGKYNVLLDNIKRLLQTDNNFVYVNDLLEIIKDLEEE